MSPSPEDAFLLYKIIFQDELYALIKTPENERFPLSTSERRIIRNNNESVAEYAAQYYIDNYGINLDDESIVQEAIDESIREALRHFG